MGKDLTAAEELALDELAAAEIELRSLEQRKKQQGGPRNRANRGLEDDDELLSSHVNRKDRDATPPWKRTQKGPDSSGLFPLSSISSCSSELATLDRHDPYNSSIGSDDQVKQLRKRNSQNGLGTGERRNSVTGEVEGGAEGAWRSTGAAAGVTEKTTTQPGRPQFFNSKKKAAGSTWRDKVGVERNDWDPSEDDSDVMESPASRPQLSADESTAREKRRDFSADHHLEEFRK